MTDLSQLIDKLEKAEAGNTTLDFEIQDALGRPPNWDDPQWPCYPITTSLDAAIALVKRVLPGWGWYRQPLADGTIYMGVTPKSRQHVPAAGAWSNHSSMCVALCIALLKALQAKEAGQ